MERLNREGADSFVPHEVLQMYKIEGYEGVNYEKYLASKDLLESRVDGHEYGIENQRTLSKIRDDILNQNKADVASSISEALQDDDIEVQRLAASMIQHASEDQREGLAKMVHLKIVDALNNPNIEIQRIAVNMIQFAPEDSEASIRSLVLQKITDALNSEDVGNQRVMAKKIDSAPEDAQDSLRELVYQKIIEALNHDDIRVQRLAASMVQYAPTEKQAELKEDVSRKYELAKQQRKANQIVESPLYIRNNRGDYSALSHEKFSKTGTETTLLLGEQFKNNLIIRHIEEPCFLAWQKAYESHEEWSEAGFDYVPIEPIYSFRHSTNTDLIDVASGVLDLNLDDWYLFSGETFKGFLDEQKTKIVDVLTKFGIEHNNINNGNFCLRFYRDADGNVDINKQPRVYLIDFDRAEAH